MIGPDRNDDGELSFQRRLIFTGPLQGFLSRQPLAGRTKQHAMQKANVSFTFFR